MTMVDDKKTTTSTTATKAATTTKKKDGSSKPKVAEEAAAPYPNMQLGQEIHRLTVAFSNHTTTTNSMPKLPNGSDALPLLTKVFGQIATELENPSLYRHLQHIIYGDNMNLPDAKVVSAAKLTVDDLNNMQKRHDLKLQQLEAAVDEARESAGDMEVLDARIAVARFASQSLSCEQALSSYEKVIEWNKISTGKKMDAYMECARISSFYNKSSLANEYIIKAEKVAQASGGGDWDRRNRLKVYRAIQHLVLHRDTKSAGPLLLDCIATFSCTEMCSYQDFCIYAILSNILHLPRPLLQEKIINGPEIRTVANEIPDVINLVQSFYDCNYKAYLHAMVKVEAVLRADRYLAPHTQYWMRELHLLAYQQFLDAYQSVTLQAMADAFGVSVEFLDYHCSRFIAANRLSAKIDKYGGVIVTNRPDLKNAQYREMIQKGDLLLNRIQKLARVVDL